MDTGTDQLSPPFPITPLPVGALAPDFTLSHAPGAPISLHQWRGQPVILAFYPSGWDPARAVQREQYNKLLSQVRGAGAELLGLSMDGPLCQLAFADEQVQFPLLADLEPEGRVAKQYGVAGRQALFVVDGAGVIRWSHVSPVGIAPRTEELLAALDSLRPTPKSSGRKSSGLSRREFMAATLAAAFALTLPFGAEQASAQGPGTVAPKLTPGSSSSAGTMPVTLTVNGTDHALQIEPRVTLLDALRERIGLTGSKKGCDHGQCGACTVQVDGRRINSCLSLAVANQGKKITTIEGLASGEDLHPMQAAFLTHDGFQCGYCTPGQIMSAVALLEEPVGPADSDVRESMSGNICRCGAYPNIVAAIQEVRSGGKNAPV